MQLGVRQAAKQVHCTTLRHAGSGGGGGEVLVEVRRTWRASDTVQCCLNPSASLSHTRWLAPRTPASTNFGRHTPISSAPVPRQRSPHHQPQQCLTDSLCGARSHHGPRRNMALLAGHNARLCEPVRGHDRRLCLGGEQEGEGSAVEGAGSAALGCAGTPRWHRLPAAWRCH
jgi:hypothetical protein